jgi:hypothetical protein
MYDGQLVRTTNGKWMTKPPADAPTATRCRLTPPTSDSLSVTADIVTAHEQRSALGHDRRQQLPRSRQDN